MSEMSSDAGGVDKEVDKMVDDFLSELDALSDSLAVPGEKHVPDKAEQPGHLPEPDSEVALPENPPVPAVEATRAEPPKASLWEQHFPASNPAPYRNIDILLMDKVAPAPVRKRSDEYESLYDYRTLYRSPFWRFKHPRVLLWAATSVALLCLVGAVYFLDPFGLARLTPGEAQSPPTTPSAPDPFSITPAVAMDKIVPSYPSKARKLGITGVVELEVDVDEQGKVGRVSAVSGPALLRTAATQAVKKCRFRPANRAGVNLKSTIRVSVPFNP